MTKIKLGFSTCPNDTFMFDAMVNRRIDCESAGFEVTMADIEELNRMVMDGIPDISKISFAVYPEVSDRYVFLNSGSAVGYKNGPLIISRKKIYPDEIADVHIAIPGIHTTANHLLGILFPPVKKKTAYLFSDIEEAVLSGESDAGLIIHETRFTYAKKGLRKVADLGEQWEHDFDAPVPLGGIVIRRDLDAEVIRMADRLMKSSVQFARSYPTASEKFVRDHAQEMSDEVMRRHIDLYVNEFSEDLGEKGRKAIEFFFRKGSEKGFFDMKENQIFVK